MKKEKRDALSPVSLALRGVTRSKANNYALYNITQNRKKKKTKNTKRAYCSIRRRRKKKKKDAQEVGRCVL